VVEEAENMSERITNKELTMIKLQLLANGISFDSNFLKNYNNSVYIEKRWAYGNGDEEVFACKIPPEIKLKDIVVAVHYRKDSKWVLTYSGDKYSLNYNDSFVTDVTFPLRPKFYDEKLKDGTDCRSVGTLYGGGALGIFSPGSCYNFKQGVPCKLSSLEPTRSKLGDHVKDISPELAAELVEVALTKDSNLIGQIMLNGGNYPSNDYGFLKQVNTAKLIREKMSGLGLKDNIEVHLISMPPDDLSLLDELSDLDVQVSMNIEVYSPEIFEDIAPGKHKFYGRNKIIKGLEKAVDILGKGNVFTVFLGGLEPMQSLENGLYFMAQKGINPVINVFHPDPKSGLGQHPCASIESMEKMGEILQEVYKKFNFRSLFQGFGRNSLDNEAYLGYFG